MEKNWQLALTTFRRAAEDAKNFSLAENRNAELSRAWRGEGYTLVELNQLDEAEKMYRRCLALDKNDRSAAAELQYVLEQKAKR